MVDWCGYATELAGLVREMCVRMRVPDALAGRIDQLVPGAVRAVA